jgi:hypothetical protein
MRKITKATVVLLTVGLVTVGLVTVGLGLATGTALFAQDARTQDAQTPTNPRAGRDMMGHGMMQDMPEMMKQMRGMMDACNKMMATDQSQPSPEQRHETPPVEPK